MVNIYHSYYCHMFGCSCQLWPPLHYENSKSPLTANYHCEIPQHVQHVLTLFWPFHGPNKFHFSSRAWKTMGQGRSSPWGRWVYGISAGLAVAVVATLAIFKRLDREGWRSVDQLITILTIWRLANWPKNWSLLAVFFPKGRTLWQRLT